VIGKFHVAKVLYTGVTHDAPAYLEWLALIKNRHIPLVIIDRPQKIVFGSDCFFDILYPRASYLGVSAANLNNTSIVAKYFCAGQEALRDLDRQHTQERQKREQDFQTRQAREDQDRAVRLQRLSEQHAREDVERTVAYSNQLTDLQNHNKTVRDELQAHYDKLFAVHAANNYGVTPPGVGTLPYPEFQHGGYSPGGLVRTHPGEFVLDPATTRMAEQGMGQRLTQGGVRQMVSQSSYQGGDLIVQGGGSMTPGEMKVLFDRWFEQRMERIG